MKILITDKIQKESFKIFDNNGLEYNEIYDLTLNELEKEIMNYEAIIIRSKTKLTANILENGKNLKVIGRAGVGLDNIDLQKAEELGIKVFNTPEASSVSVAELTIGLILNLARHISKADETMHCGRWCKNDYMGYNLKDKKIGLIGFGNIGQEVAKRCSAFEMKIGVYDKEERVIELARKLGYNVYRNVDDLIEDVQIISLHLPSTNETKHTINEKRLNMMNKNTIIVNTARGNLIDESALVKALKNKHKDILNKTKVENKEGLTVSYDRDELKEKFPHLVTEMGRKKHTVKIDLIENNIDLKQLKVEISNPDELINPGAIDFLRRCTTNDEVLNILDYLLKKKEISEKEYNSFKIQILKGEGLKAFIDKHGGFKGHGYYEKKYRNLTRSKNLSAHKNRDKEDKIQ